MNLRSIATRAAVAGATTALAAGALVGVTGTAAHAEDATSAYSCEMPGVITFATTMTVTGGLPVESYWAGANVDFVAVNINVSATVPSAVAGALGGAGVTGAKSDDYAITLGSGSVPIPISGGFESAGGNTTWEATGGNLPFVTPDPATVDGFLPTSFTMIATKADGSSFGAPLTCTLTDEAPGEIVTDFVLMKQASATTAKAVKAKKGKKAVLPVSVMSTSLGGPVLGGSVVAKEGSKTLAKGTLVDGVAKLNLGKKLKPGKHKITVTYGGLPSVGGSTAKTTVTITK